MAEVTEINLAPNDNNLDINIEGKVITDVKPENLVQTLVTEMQGKHGTVQINVPVAWLAFDEENQVVANLLTDFETSAQKYLDAIRMNGIGKQLEQKNDLKFTEQTPVVLILQFKNEQPSSYAQIAWFGGWGSYLAGYFLGEQVMVQRQAMRMGFYDHRTQAWDPQALALTGLVEEQLPTLVETLPKQISREFAAEHGLDSELQIVFSVAKPVL